MNIQWFPGHMSKTLRQIESLQKKVDVIVYVLDARAPLSCLNPSISKIVENKPIVYVLNKIDMANSEQTKKWIEYFSNENNTAVGINATNNNCNTVISGAISHVLSKKMALQKEKGINKIFRGMVVGIPNAGKSTLINTLCGQAKTKTGNIAGVTKSVQWVSLNNGVQLMDSPGTLWPKFLDEKTALNLAFIGSIKDEIVDTTELAFELIKLLKNIAPKQLKERFGFKSLDFEPIELFDEICKKRGCILKKNELDYERCGKLVLDDFRKCRIGKITLELVNDERAK